MTTSRYLSSALALLCLSAQAQTAPPRLVRAFGEATVSATPDQARIQFAAVTQAPTADAASSQNAIQVTTLIAALRSLVGSNGDVRTLSYSLSPNYNSPRDGSPSMIVGYTASNVVQATASDLSIIGKLIDVGIQAGANRVQGLSFGVKNDEPMRQQALKLATAEAKARADAMASGLNVRTGAVFSIAEGASAQPVGFQGALAAAPSTPIEAGPVDVHAAVTVELEITQ